MHLVYPQAAQTHVTRKGVKWFTCHRCVTFLLNLVSMLGSSRFPRLWGRSCFLLDASVSRYRRPLKIRDFVREIKYWDLRTLNNVKSNFSFNEINKKDLPAIYSTVFRCLLVTRERSQGWSLRSGKDLDQSPQKCRFFPEIQVCCKFLQLQPKRETSFPL